VAPSDSDVPVLTDAERARLRPTVNADAFERFLAAIPEEVRPGVKRAAVLHFSRAVTMADIRDFLSDVGSDEAAAAVDRAIAKTPAEPADAAPADARPADARPADEPDAIAHAPPPPVGRLFSMEPPESPRLRALWDAIEPPQQPPASG
jgi:hypothetical protein